MRRGNLIGDIDMLIVATAIEQGLTVVTIDPDFRRVPGLDLILLTRSELVS
jgi:predicted nucleic acid-binding protein